MVTSAPQTDELLLISGGHDDRDNSPEPIRLPLAAHSSWMFTDKVKCRWVSVVTTGGWAWGTWSDQGRPHPRHLGGQDRL
jgi:hypothetical protein